jgi:multiple sugar transport system substrate-binding protein
VRSLLVWVMKVSQRLAKLGKYLGQTQPSVWIWLAVLQIAFSIALLLTWPPVTLKFVVPTTGSDYWLQLTQKFQQENPKIRLNLIKGPYTTDEVEAIYTSDFEAGNSTYDLVYMDIIWVPRFADPNADGKDDDAWVADLSDKLSQKEQAEFLQSDLRDERYKGRLYRIPAFSDVGMLYYNKNLLKQVGVQPPKSFDDLSRIFETLKNKQLEEPQKVNYSYIYVWQGKPYEGLAVNFLEILQSLGGFWIQGNEVGLDRPEAIAAAQFLHDTLYKTPKQPLSPLEVKTYGEEESLERFKQGDVVFLRNWSSFSTQVDRAKFGFEPLVDKQSRIISSKGGWGFSIAKQAKHPKEAWEAIKFFTSEENQRWLLEKGFNYSPSRKKLFTDPTLLNVIQNSVARPQIPQYSKVSQILRDCLTTILTQPQDADENNIKNAMEDAAKKTRQCLKDVKSCDRVS